MSDCTHGGRDVYERPESVYERPTCGTYAYFAAHPHYNGIGACLADSFRSINGYRSAYPMDMACKTYEPRTDSGCPQEPCETIKRQARRIRELMEREEKLAQVARDMLDAMDGCHRMNADEIDCGKCRFNHGYECSAYGEYKQRLKELGVIVE